MKYSVYGRFKVEVVRQDDGWRVYRIGQGIKRPDPNVQIPPDASKPEILMALDDTFHELAVPGASIEEIGE